MYMWERRASAYVGGRQRRSLNQTAWVGRMAVHARGSIVVKTTSEVPAKTRPRGRATRKKKSNGNGAGEIEGNELQKAYRQLLDQHRDLTAESEAMRREYDLVQEYLDAAGVPDADQLPSRIVLVAKEWFRSHPTGSNDHVSARMRSLMLKAGEVDFIYSGSF